MKELIGSEMLYVNLTDIDPMLEKSIKKFYGMLEQENQINNLLRLNLLSSVFIFNCILYHNWYFIV